MSNRRTRSALLTGIIAVLALVTSCSLGGSGSTTSGPILIADVSPLTGVNSENNIDIPEGTKAAVTVINANGGLLGRQVKLDYVDTIGDPGDAITAVNKELAVASPVMFIGPVSVDIKAVQPLFDRAHIVDGFQGGSTLFDTNPDKWLYRCNASDSELGVAMGVLGSQKGYKRAAYFFDNSSSSETLVPVIQKAFAALGGTNVAKEIVTASLTTYRSEVQNIINAHPDVIFYSTDPSTASVVFSDFQQLNNLAVPFIGTDAGANIVKSVGPKVAKAHMISVQGSDALTPAGATFVTAYQQANGHLPLSGAEFAYDCTIDFALAIAEAGSSDPNVWQPKIQVSDESGTPVSTFQDGIAAIKAGKTIDYDGVSGPMDFDQYHNVTGAWDVVQATGAADGGLTTLETITGAQISAAIAQGA